MMFRLFIFIVILFSPLSFLVAQNESNKLFFIVTILREEYIGSIEAQTEKNITLRLINKETIVIDRSDIKLFQPVTEDNFLRGRYAYPNRHASRYLVGSSAIPLGRKHVSYTSYYAFAWTLNYGITDNYSVGLSSTLWGTPVMLNAQANYKIGEQLYLGATATGGWFSWIDPKIFFGYGGLRLTTGPKNNNYTFGGGIFSLKADLNIRGPGNVSLGDFGYVNFASMKRYTRRIYGVSEVWILKNLYLKRSIYAVNLGAKIIRKERSAWTFFVSTVAFHELRSGDLQIRFVPCGSWSIRLGKLAD